MLLLRPVRLAAGRLPRPHCSMWSCWLAQGIAARQSQGAGRGSQGAGINGVLRIAGVQELTAQQAEVQAEAARVQEERLRVGRLKQQLEQAVARLEGERAVWERQKVGAKGKQCMTWAHACFSKHQDGGRAGSIGAREGSGHRVQCLCLSWPCA